MRNKILRILIMVIILISFNLISCGKQVNIVTSTKIADVSTTMQVNTTSTTETTITEIAQVETTVKDETTTTEGTNLEIKYLQKGEIVSIANWDYKVKDVKVQENIGEFSAQGIFIVALVEVTNTSNSEKEVGSEIFKAMDGQERIYNMNSEVSLEYYQENNSDLWHLEKIGPSLTGVLPVVFDVPKDATNIALIIENDDSNPILLSESINN